MDVSTFSTWLFEHVPSLVGGGLVATVLIFYIQKKKLRSEIRHTDAQAEKEETGTLKEQVGVTASIVTFYKDTTVDFAERMRDLSEENKGLRRRLKRRDARIESLEQQNVILRDMKGVPPEEKHEI